MARLLCESERQSTSASRMLPTRQHSIIRFASTPGVPGRPFPWRPLAGHENLVKKPRRSLWTRSGGAGTEKRPLEIMGRAYPVLLDLSTIFPKKFSLRSEHYFTPLKMAGLRVHAWFLANAIKAGARKPGGKITHPHSFLGSSSETYRAAANFAGLISMFSGIASPFRRNRAVRASAAR